MATDYRHPSEICPEATRHDEDRDGKCRWCGRKVSYKIPRPSAGPLGWGPSYIDTAYGLYWDPDWPYEEKRYET